MHSGHFWPGSYFAPLQRWKCWQLWLRWWYSKTMQRVVQPPPTTWKCMCAPEVVKNHLSIIMCGHGDSCNLAASQLGAGLGMGPTAAKCACQLPDQCCALGSAWMILKALFCRKCSKRELSLTVKFRRVLRRNRRRIAAYQRSIK